MNNLYIPQKVQDKDGEIKILYLVQGNEESLINPTQHIDLIGFNSIDLIEAEENKLIEIISHFKVQKLVYIMNADCRDIDGSLLINGKDISKPIFDKYNWIVELTDKIKAIPNLGSELDFFFYTIAQNSLKEDVFTLKDLLSVAKNESKLKDVLAEIKHTNQRKPFFFIKKNISSKFAGIKDFFGLNNAGYFYAIHKAIIADKDFMFKGQVWACNEEKQKVLLKLPDWGINTLFIGDDFYKRQESLDAKGNVNGKNLVRRKKSTLQILHGDNFVDYIKPYHYIGFANVPDNFNYKETQRGYYNRYSEIAYKPKKGSIENVLSMVKHVFGEKKITHNGLTLKRYEIALDYIQILITEPTHPLPILILFSVERETGKSTFPQFLKTILGTNAVKVGNKAFDSEFNEIFADKLMIWCDETLLDRKPQAEKIKDLSTSKYILVNPKGTAHYEIPFFGKFIFTSNNKRMVYVDKNSVRFWINEVPRLKHDDPLFIEKLESEIPAFLDFLKNRQLKTKRETRMHFNVNWIHTDALTETVKVNEPRDVAHLRECLREMFLDIPKNGEEIKMTLTDINNEFFGGKKDKPWIKEILIDFFEMGKNNISPKLTRYDYWKLDREEKKNVYIQEKDKNGKVVSVENTGEMEFSQQVIKVKKSGRPYTFKKADFIGEIE